jgi:hypothetical protein
MNSLPSASKIMYIGAGLDLAPLDHLKTANEFVYVDTLPRSEFDRKGTFREYYYRDDFVDRLKDSLKDKGFMFLYEEVLDPEYFTDILSWYQRLVYLNKVKQTFPYICPTRLIFYNNNTKQTLKYYVSTNLEYNMPDNYLCSDLETCDGWIVSGFHPPKCLSYYISMPLIFYGYSSTVFVIKDKDREEDTLISWMVNANPFYKIGFIRNYICCNRDDGTLIECKDIIDLNSQCIKIRNKKQSQLLLKTEHHDLTRK